MREYIPELFKVMHSSRIIPLLAALLLLGAARLGAQSLIVFNVDLSSYPEVGADLMVMDSLGNPLRDFSPADFEVIDDIQDVSSTVTVDCPHPTNPSAFSVVLANDQSASMNEDAGRGKTRFELMKEGVTAFVQTVDFTPPTMVAITAFADAPSIVSDFKNTTTPLINSLGSITLGGGTDFAQAFLNSRAGAIPLLRTRPDTVRRIVVFLTDGFPNNAPPVGQIVSEAIASGIQIYTIAVGTPMTDDLKSLALMTGGIPYGNVQTPLEMQAIYRQIALTGRGYSPCHIRWRTHLDCAPGGKSHQVKITLKTKGASNGVVYQVPTSSLVSLKANPDLLWFGGAAPGAGVDKPITLTAVNSPITINSGTVTSGQPFTVLNWGGTPPPFTILAGSSRTITVRFTPPDSGSYSANLQLSSLPCSITPILLVGGLRRSGASSSLRLLSPLGKETFAGCDSVMIRWGGVDPTDTVKLEYSSDDGATWQPITDRATGLSYRWMPAAPGTRYRVRVSVEASVDHRITTVAGGGAGDDGGQATSAILSAPTGVAIADTILYIAESGDNRVRVVDFRSGIIKTLAGTGFPGHSNDGGQASAARLFNPNDVLLVGTKLYIADYSNHRVRMVDLETGIITTVAGTGNSGYSGDEGPATSADLQYPAYLAYGGNSIYITDFGNARIRRIDLSTGIIRTIAGGGTNPFSEGRPAIEAILKKPAGIVVVGDTLFIAESGGAKVRRVDLKTGIFTTYAGTGTAGYGGDNGPADQAMLDMPIGLEATAGALFVSDANNNRIRRIDFDTRIVTTFAGTGQPGFSGDDGDALAARLNYPGRPVSSASALLVPDVRNNRVRSISFGRIAGEDASTSSFGVTVPRVSISSTIAGKQVDLGRMALGRTRDSLVATVICNTGNQPLRIDSITIAGANPGDFSVTGGVLGSEIPPGGCRSIELVFRPGAVGARGAIAVVHGGCAASDTLRLAGTGIAPCNDTSLVFADLGVVAVSATSEATLTTAICNRGGSAFSGTVTLLPADGSFSIVSGGGAFTLGPNECRTVVVRFAPSAPGRASAVLDYGIPSECGALRTSLFGQAIAPAHLDVLKSLTMTGPLCWDGARDTTILLYNSGDDTLRVTEISLTKNDEGFSVPPPAPTPTTPLLIPPLSGQRITIHFDPAAPGQKSGTIRIVSNDPTGPISIDLAARRDSVHAQATSQLLNFGRPSGVSYPRDSFVVIQNTGTVPVTITGGAIDGADRDQFLFDPAQLPITIGPGSSAKVKVTILAPADENPFNASLALRTDPTCDSGVVRVALLGPGALPVATVEGPSAIDITCSGAATLDTTITIRNDGGSQLRITGIAVTDDGQGSFSALPLSPDPLLIEPGARATVRYRFTPGSTGTKHGVITLTDNVSGGATSIAIDATYERISFTLPTSPIDFGSTSPTLPVDRQIQITNTGSTPLRWMLPASVGAFQLQSVTPATADPGASSVAVYRFVGTDPGEYRETIDVGEERCGTSSPLALRAVISEKVITTVQLPIDSALIGVRVLLPVRMAPNDPAAFERSGASRFTGTLQVDGVSLVVDTLLGARIVNRSYEGRGRSQTITFEGTYAPASGDLLMRIGGRTFNTDTTWKTLKLTAFAWDAPGVSVTLVPGAFRVYGPCYNGQDLLVATPRVSKVTPMPISGDAGVELEVPEGVTARAALYDARGVETLLLADRYLTAGTHVLVLHAAAIPSGSYNLVIRTPFGVSSRPIIVQK